MGDDEPVAVSPSLEVTLNPVIVPGIPAKLGAVNATDAFVFPPVAVTLVGTPGGISQLVSPMA